LTDLEDTQLPNARKEQEKRANLLKELQNKLEERDEMLEEATRKVQDVEVSSGELSNIYIFSAYTHTHTHRDTETM
jgi:hypothetical protein